MSNWKKFNKDDKETYPSNENNFILYEDSDGTYRTTLAFWEVEEGCYYFYSTNFVVDDTYYMIPYTYNNVIAYCKVEYPPVPNEKDIREMERLNILPEITKIGIAKVIENKVKENVADWQWDIYVDVNKKLEDENIDPINRPDSINELVWENWMRVKNVYKKIADKINALCDE